MFDDQQLRPSVAHRSTPARAFDPRSRSHSTAHEKTPRRARQTREIEDASGRSQLADEGVAVAPGHDFDQLGELVDVRSSSSKRWGIEGRGQDVR